MFAELAVATAWALIVHVLPMVDMGLPLMWHSTRTLVAYPPYPQTAVGLNEDVP